MMHKIKKAAAQVTVKTTPESAEYAEYVVKLANLSAYLKAASVALGESEKTWKDVCQKQKTFAEAFANKYPDKDKVREFVKTSASKSQALVKEFVLKTEGSSAPYHDLDAMVQSYLSEIAAVQEQYKEITDLNTEMQMYSKKVDDLSKAKKTDEARTARNMDKLEEAKKQYDSKLDVMVEKMKHIYSRRAIVLKAAYVAYWSSQLRAFDLLSESLKDTREFVSGAVEPLRKIKIDKLSESEIEEFVKANTAGISTDKISPPASPDEKMSPTTFETTAETAEAH